MRIINIHEAKTHLSKFVEQASKGEEMVIAKAGKPMARLGPIRPESKNRKLGPLAGKFSVPADFDAPLPEEIVAAFEDRGDAPAR